MFWSPSLVRHARTLQLAVRRYLVTVAIRTAVYRGCCRFGINVVLCDHKDSIKVIHVLYVCGSHFIEGILTEC